MIKTADKRSALRRTFRSLALNSQTLLAALEAEHSAAAAAAAEPSVAGSSMNGQAVSLFEPGKNSPTSQEIANMWEELITLCERTGVALTGTPTDGEIYVEMLAVLQPIKETYGSYAGLRYGYV